LDLVHKMFEAVDVGLAIFDTELRIIQINRVLADLHGVSHEPLAGKILEEIIPTFAAFVRPLARSRNHGESGLRCRKGSA
jgi:PAS domain S-box-containing protein